jgi:hypothetical protein
LFHKRREVSTMTKTFARLALILVSVLAAFSVSVTAAHAASNRVVGPTFTDPRNSSSRCHNEMYIYTSTNDNGVPVVYANAQVICNLNHVVLTSEAWFVESPSIYESWACTRASRCAVQAEKRNPAGSQRFCGRAAATIYAWIPPGSTEPTACINA